MKSLLLLFSILSFVKFSHTTTDLCVISENNQSPIAISTNDSIFSQKLQNLHLLVLEKEHNVTVTAENTGFAVVLFLNKKIKLNKTYELSKIKFHWGNDSQRGSEHTIDGKRFAGEVEFFLDDIEKKKHAVTFPPGHPGAGFPPDVTEAIFSVLLIENHTLPQDISFLQSLKEKLPFLNYSGNRTTYDTGKHIEELEKLPNIFFNYMGSLSSFPCYGDKQRYVYRYPVSVTTEFLQRLRSLKGYGGQPLVNNYRPLQPLNGRPIYKSFE